MSKKNIQITIAVAVIVGAASFYGGMKYDQSKTASDRRSRMAQFGGSGFGGMNGVTSGQNGQRARGGNGTGFVSGEVIGKDDKSITVKLGAPRMGQDGQSGLPGGASAESGSKVIFLSGSTSITKSASGSASDLAVGEQVTVTGSTNSDGSVTAQSIQIRPAAAK